MKHFILSEFLQSPKARALGISMIPTPEVRDNIYLLVENILDPLREEINLPIRITSGWRPHDVNRAVGGAKDSQHVTGQAADIQIYGMTPKQVCRKIIDLQLPFDQLINEFDSWTHVSFSRRCRNQVLRATKIYGKTTYRPYNP